jgi:endonuclease I
MRIKQIIKLVLVAIILTNCSDSDSLTAPIPKPIAYNDLYSTTQNKELLITNALENDDNAEGTTLELDASSTLGEVVNEDGIISFTPQNNFAGTDSFKYTICETVENNCSTATVFIQVEGGSASVAVRDSYSTIANKSITINNLLENDIIINNATLKSVDKVAITEGEVELNSGNVIYTPKTDFTGEDSFTYTICDENDVCSSALVIITVAEGLNAVNDSYNASNTKATAISDFLNNDFIIDGTIVKEIGTSTTEGTVELQENGSIIYTPKAGFTGEDTFTYTICDDDTQDSVCDTATVTVNVIATISFNIPAALEDYYSDVLFAEDKTILTEEAKNLTEEKHTTKLIYTQRHNFLYDADEDPTNTANVVLIYSGESRDEREWSSSLNSHTSQTFNTEHVYPQSFLGDNDIAKADLHLLRVCDASINTSRSNLPFIEGSGGFQRTSSTGWYPGDEWRGDVARIIFYVNLYYDEPISDVGTLEVLLKWNAEDPVSAIEEQRNTVIFGAQGNRNPFIDNPYLATLIWGGDAAENKWQ